MAGEVRGVFRRPLGRLRQPGGRQRLKLKRRRSAVGERSAVRKRRPVGANERRAIALDRPFERAAAGPLLRLNQPRRRDQRDRREPSRKGHCEVTAVAGGSGLRSVSALAPCRNSTAASSWVSLARSGGT